MEARIETMELVRVIDRWLTELPVDNRVLFLRRYWFGDTVNRLR
ncbi:MAG: hypothetical protein ACOX25_01360 [Caldicoprobacterales bacterium]